MGTPGSVPNEPPAHALPVALAPVAVLLGIGAMKLFQIALGLLMLDRSGALARALAPLLGLRPILLVSELLLVAPGLVLAAVFARPLAASLGLRGVPKETLALSLLAGATLWVTSLGLFEVQNLFWSPPEGYLDAFRRLHEALRPAGPLDAVVSVVAIAVAPALCEELLFRGIVLPSLLGALGSAAAVLGSAALFGLIHLDFATGPTPSAYRVPFAFAIGIALGLLRLRTGALSPSMAAHAMLNTITFVAAPLTDDPGALPEAHPVLGVSLLLAGLVSSAFVLRALAPSLTRARPPA